MHIRYNAPITLTFALFATLVLALDQLAGTGLVNGIFSLPAGADMNQTGTFLRLLAYPLGHFGWQHLLGNFAFLLLLGPALEEKYGSGPLFIMILITTIITGILNILLLPNGLVGASGIVFMMILLTSFANFRRGEIPLTFILVLLIYLTKEIIGSMESNQVSELAHIAGGALGSLLGFLFSGRRRKHS
ncbi:MAG: rhomboid family intramembrane serine protease [Spirochaetales bacterium]|nr:rhomboid family intramembrane serine protease [Spirochaetales bacterium]MCF7939189.1 rhomboid family intramembrane serine protease [Spirochaetales bacterium]